MNNNTLLNHSQLIQHNYKHQAYKHNTTTSTLSHLHIFIKFHQLQKHQVSPMHLVTKHTVKYYTFHQLSYA